MLDTLSRGGHGGRAREIMVGAVTEETAATGAAGVAAGAGLEVLAIGCWPLATIFQVS